MSIDDGWIDGLVPLDIGFWEGVQKYRRRYFWLSLVRHIVIQRNKVCYVSRATTRLERLVKTRSLKVQLTRSAAE